MTVTQLPPTDGAHRSSEQALQRSLNLRVGEWVEVRPLDEVLVTLDAQGCLDAMPFMPEMARFCGQRFQVFKTANKTCDSIETFWARRLEDTVHLTGLRCDGGYHGGCQAGCLIFWKEAWLRRVDGPRATNGAAGAPIQTKANPLGLATLQRQARHEDPSDGEPRYRCQATELPRATVPLSLFEPRQYLRDLTGGNLTLWALLRSAAIALYIKQMRLLHVVWNSCVGRSTTKSAPVVEKLDLQAGDLVQVRSKAEIMATLEDGERNRGLSFDLEMAPYCGKTFRVLRRVDHIVDEKTGKMLKLRKDCIILDGVVCRGQRHIRRLGCPRSIYPYWREAWLRRVESTPDQVASAGPLRDCGNCVRHDNDPSS